MTSPLRNIFFALLLMPLTAFSATNSTHQQCPFTTPTAFTGALYVKSKYETNDPTRSIIVSEIDPLSVNIQNRLNAFSSGIVNFSNFYIRYKNTSTESTVLNCLHLWLTHWAEAEALTTTESTSTGNAVRAWTLSAIASSLLKMEHLADHRWQLTETETQWLNQVAQRVLDDYSPRLTSTPSRINNIDYWAAWSLAATSQITQRSDLLDWSYQLFNHATEQITLDSQYQYAYLPKEIGRGRLAAHYSQFALTPLVKLYEALSQHDYPVTPSQSQKLSRLINFSADMMLDPDSIKHIVTLPQKRPSKQLFSWVIPVQALAPSHTKTKMLAEYLNHDVDGNPLTGGNIKPLYEIN